MCRNSDEEVQLGLREQPFISFALLVDIHTILAFRQTRGRAVKLGPHGLERRKEVRPLKFNLKYIVKVTRKQIQRSLDKLFCKPVKVRA